MNLNVNKEDLWQLRELIVEGRRHSNSFAQTTLSPRDIDNVDKAAAKFIRKINDSMVKAFGHNMNGDHLLEKNQRALFKPSVKSTLPPWPDELT